MSRDLLERFVEDRSALTADEVRALTLALAGDPSLLDQAQRLLAVDELLSRIHAPNRAAFGVVLPGTAAPPSRPGSVRLQRIQTASPSGRRGAVSARHRGVSARRRRVTGPSWLPIAGLVAAVLAVAILLLPHRATAGRVVDAPVATGPTPTAVPPPSRPSVAGGAVVATFADARAATVERGGATVAAAKGEPVRVGDIVRVAGGGVAAIAWPDGTAVACSAGELTVPAPTPGKRLRLANGALVAQVAKQAAGAPLVIESPHGACTVVGTRFAFAADDAGSRLDVQEGVVELARAHGAAISVGAGDSASAPAAPRTPRTLTADPTTIAAVAATLAPGDTLTLAPGSYGRLRLTGTRGDPDAWITITGPSAGEPARFVADAGTNTITLAGTCYVNLRHLAFDGRRVSGPFAIAAHDVAAGPVHHLRIEDCSFQDYSGTNDGTAISCKTPSWAWTIARNRIERCGTGIFLGGASGEAPAIEALIEGNLIDVDRAFCVYLAGAAARPASMPRDARATVVRDNVFIRPAGESEVDPHVVIENGVDAGPGLDDRAEISGNLFYRCRGSDAMLQANGRVAIHDNLFVDGDGPAIRVGPHQRPLRTASIWHNTIIGVPVGIRFLAAAEEDDLVAANLILAPQAVMGPVRNLVANLIDRPEAAADYVADPRFALGRLDLHPKAGAGRCGDWPQAAVAAFAARDFDGVERRDPRVAGAYAGPAAAGAWRLAAEPKPTR